MASKKLLPILNNFEDTLKEHKERTLDLLLYATFIASALIFLISIPMVFF